MTFKFEQKKRGEKLINEGFFDGDSGKGLFEINGKKKRYPFVLRNGQNNLYSDIRNGAINYFEQNKIDWWKGTKPTGHTLSSQIACLNHLFPIRKDKDAILALLKSFSDDFIDVFPISESMEGYIQFEAVGGVENLLNEGANTRGSMCTSIDALAYALNKNSKRYLILIEWKYVEVYDDKDYSAGSKGETRKNRYTDLITESRQLNNNTFSCCWHEPFYQLMRQTLWAEQTIKHKVKGFEAEDFIHLHVIPEENAELLDKKYPCSETDLESTWKSCLTKPEKYIVISPEQLWSKQDPNSDIFQYLKQRYW